MAYSYTLVSGDGTTTTFAVPFGYLDKAHVGVKVNGVTTTFSWLTGSSISISPAPANGAIIEIRRVTPKTAPPVDFTDGSVLLEEALDKEALFNLYLAQEAFDGVQQSILQNSTGVWDGQGRRATNFADPTSSADLVTKGYFDNTYGASLAASVAAAASSASSAAGSATSAAGSAAQAQDFRLRYQGSMAVAPTVRFDGSALQAGDLYFDTTSNLMKVYSGGVWVNASSAVNGIRAVFRYVASAGQTTFTGADTAGLTLAYDVGFVNVYLNGNRLDRTDFTATNGTSVVLLSGAALNDELNIEAFGTFNLASFSGAAIQDGTVTLAKLVSSIYGTSGANRLLQLDGNGFLPPVDGSQLTNVVVPAVARQAAVAGSVDANGFANMLSAGSGLTLNLAAFATPLVLSFAAGFDTSGAVNSTAKLTSDVTGVVSSLAASNLSYIYADYVSPSQVTWGKTLAPPQYGKVYDRQRQALLHFNGTAGSTTMLDDYGNTWTAQGGAKLQTNQSKFGGSALGGGGTNNALNGTTDYVRSTLASPAVLGSGNTIGTGWTLRAWVYLPAYSTASAVFGGTSGLSQGLYVNASGKCILVLSSAVNNDICNTTGTATVPLNTWTLIELTYDSVAGKYFTYVGGAPDLSITSALQVGSWGAVSIGAYFAGSLGFGTGYIDEFEYLPYCDHPNGVAYSVPVSAPSVSNAGYSSDFFNTSEMKMYSVSGPSTGAGVNPTFTTKKRLYVAEAITGASSVTAVDNYGLNAQYLSDVFGFTTSTTYARSHRIGVPPNQITFGYNAHNPAQGWTSKALAFSTYAYAACVESSKSMQFQTGSNGVNIFGAGYSTGSLQFSATRNW